MLALEYLDYPMGNHQIRFPEVRERARAERLNTLGFGGGVLLSSSVPLLNLFVMPAAVAGATVLYLRTGHGAAAVEHE